MYDELIKKVDRGREGLNMGLYTGFERLDDYLGGVQKETYYAIGSVTGVGKTALVDHIFVLNPYEFILKNPQYDLRIFYWSLEISKMRKIAKWVCYKMYMDHKIICSLKEVLSLQKNRLSDEKYNLVVGYREYFEKMLEKVEIHDYKDNPTGIHKYRKSFFEKNGVYKIRQVMKEGVLKDEEYYVPNNPNLFVLDIIDHVGLMRKEQGFSKKENIDKMDEYNVEDRNRWGLSPIMVFQFNRDLADINRQRFKELTPLLEDFKDTGNVSESANIVMTPFSPKRYNINKYQGYDLVGQVGYGQNYDIRDVFRSIFILKNRDDADGVSIGTRFLGQCGYFEELLPPEEFEKERTLYTAVNQF